VYGALSVSHARLTADSAQIAMLATIGIAVPSVNRPLKAMALAPKTNWKVPISADAVPALAPCRSSASTDVAGITSPRKP
jgi:hypothetical protein